MAIDVNKPSYSEYSTKPTSQAPPPPCRDHQHNKNQTNPTITTQDQAIDAFHNMTQDAAWPMSKWEIFAAVMDTAVFAPVEDTPGFTDSDFDEMNDHKPITENQVTPMITEDESNEVKSNEVTTSNDYYDNNPTIPTTTSKDRPDPPGFSVFDQVDNDDEVVLTPAGMFNCDDEFTANTTTEDEEGYIATTRDEEEIPIPPSNFDIDDEFTTSNTTTATTHQIVIPPASTTHTKPKDQQVAVITNNVTNKKKEK